MTVHEVVDARKVRIDDAEARALLQTASRVSIAKGKKVQSFDPESDDMAEILKQAMGPSGNLRAPTYRVGDQIIIVFNADLYADWVK